MPKTFNRNPYSVNIPDSNDIKNYFFNHYNWKGLNDDKNFLSIDQETFSDCKNVYVDEEGLLKSRPSQKYKAIVYTDANSNEVALANIVDCWIFENVSVYKTENNGKYYLTFINKNFDKNLQVELVHNNISYNKIKLIVADQKIFVFAENDFNYYDMKTNEYLNADKFIHIPVTSVITNGVPKSTTEVESPNVLTTSYITKYLYTSTENIQYSTFIGKEVTVEIDGVKYTITFKNNNQVVFVEKFISLSEANYSNEQIYGVGGEGIPFIEIGSTGECILSSYKVVDNKQVWTIYKTSDGQIFEKLPDIEDVITSPKISRDGNYCIVFKKDGPYIYSLAKTSEGNYKYTTWTNLLQHYALTKNNTTDKYDELKLNLDQSFATYNYLFRPINAIFFDDTIFAFTYADGIAQHSQAATYVSDAAYTNLYCIYCVNDNNIYKQELFSNKSNYYGPVYSNNIDDVEAGINLTFTKIQNDNIYTFTSNTITQTISNSYTKYKILESQTNKSNNEQTIDIVIKSEVYFTYTNTSTNDPSASRTTLLIHPRAIITFNNETLYDNTFESINTKVIYLYSAQNITNRFFRGSNDLFNYELKVTYNLEHVISDCTLTITAKLSKLPIKEISFGNDTIIKYNNSNYYCKLFNEMPIIDLSVNKVDQVYVKIAIRIKTLLITNKYSVVSNADKYYLTYILDNTESKNTGWYTISKQYQDINRSLLYDGLMVTNDSFVFTRIYNSNLYVYTSKISDRTNLVPSDDFADKKLIEENLSENIAYNKYVFSYPNGHLVTNNKLYQYTDYSNINDITYISLLFNALPVSYYYEGNKEDSLYLVANNYLYKSTNNTVIGVSELTKGENHYLLPDFDALLENYYFSKDNVLYISSPVMKLELERDGSINREKSTSFEWYLPIKTKQEFDYNITNLHVISSSEVAIFFDNSISYVTWDNDTNAYRYYKSKIQVGCKNGSDVITSYDGKYVIFTTWRGLVAMSYQEFMATSEQTLTYLSDTIFSVFKDYITESNSMNKIKLFKYSYWIVVYKQDSKFLLLFDIRNNSWWPLEYRSNLTKFVLDKDTPMQLSNGKMFTLDKNETHYYDDNNITVRKIDWYIQSQKLHLNALNYYKHIVNMTFTSVHNKQLLEQEEYDADLFSFKLQVNNYRKKVDGNINNEDEFVSIVYNVESARTFVQRLNYSKVNEFQYLLSSDDENAIDIPLSLNSITIKYKIGSQVR